MTLAQRLDELAVANAEGRLSDDEYRLLRQNLFERFGSGAVVPGEPPVVPIGGQTKHIKGASVSSSSTQPKTQPRTQSVQVESARISLISPTKKRPSGVTNFIRIATGKADPLSHQTSPHDPSSGAAANQPKRNLVSRILLRKGSKQLAVRTDLPVQTSQSHPSSPVKLGTTLGSSSSTKINTLAPPSPGRGYPRRHSPASTPPLSPSSSRHVLPLDVYNDNNLVTSKDIQQEIAHVEVEYKNLLDAFNGLEMTTLVRTQVHELRRLPVQTPTSPLALMAGHDWRDYSQTAASTSTLPVADGGDHASIRSTSSRKSSRSSSSGNLFGRGKQHSGIPQRVSSPLSPLKRAASTKKSSTSSLSLSSQGTPHSSSSMPARLNATLHPGMHGTFKPSRSANHLPLSALHEHPSRTSQDVIDLADPENTPRPASSGELEDVRYRKAELMKRYEARLEYLRARLKSALLHEKLLRK
ncbi:hypothetical protein PC9H_009506 [Pleurotus ostreatus]|uniref:Uncharacterized protein n=1 Tax=Pleurotus ostreatus TaxID=5322 RepID=A0A8H6ZP77_PLEOS|nr:uncharacterized protein PC9H_009506 [Pleurotus ostreatus]KAF7424202.1 hypothetical protein PC9H_009506 [Pleurotus ostreatus]